MSRLKDFDLPPEVLQEQRPEAAPQDPVRGYSIEGAELRGYEIAEWMVDVKGDGKEHWVQLMKYPPDGRGLKNATAEATRLFEANKERIIRIRPIVSFDPATLKQEA